MYTHKFWTRKTLRKGLKHAGFEITKTSKDVLVIEFRRLENGQAYEVHSYTSCFTKYLEKGQNGYDSKRPFNGGTENDLKHLYFLRLRIVR